MSHAVTGELTFVPPISGGGVDVQTFYVNGEWIKPAGAKRVHYELVAPGGGGGSGAVGVGVSGGGGGAPGQYQSGWINADVVADLVLVRVGLGGLGGKGSGDNLNPDGKQPGNPGQDGTSDTSFGTYAIAGRGRGGKPGSITGDSGSVSTYVVNTANTYGSKGSSGMRGGPGLPGFLGGGAGGGVDMDGGKEWPGGDVSPFSNSGVDNSLKGSPGDAIDPQPGPDGNHSIHAGGNADLLRGQGGAGSGAGNSYARQGGNGGYYGAGGGGSGASQVTTDIGGTGGYGIAIITTFS